MRKSVLIVGMTLVALVFLFSVAAHAQTQYTCTVDKVVPWASLNGGETRIQVKNGSPAFTDAISKVYIDAADPGANRMVAVLLTAVSLGQQVTIGVTGTPSWATPLKVQYVGLVAP